MSQAYSLSEIAENNGENGKPVWLIIKGSVYDVTQFVDEHPGGRDLLLEHAGRDATKDFNEAGHSADALGELKKYKIGVVATNEIKEPNYNKNTTQNKPQTQTQDYSHTQKKRIKFFFCF